MLDQTEDLLNFQRSGELDPLPSMKHLRKAGSHSSLRPSLTNSACIFSSDLELTEELLRHTLQHVMERSPYYKDSLGIDADCFELKDFDDLPFLTEKEFDSHASDIRCGGPTDYLTLTGGTSRFQKIGFRSQAEFDAYSMAFGDVPSTENKGLMIELISSVHGARPFIPGMHHILRVPLNHKEHYRLIQSLLTGTAPRTDGLPSIEAIAATLTRLKQLTAYLTDNGHDPASYGLQRLVSYGWLLTNRWRKILESVWQCSVIDVYGLSEFDLAPSEQCEVCSFYHFCPAAYPEVVGVNTRRPVEPGQVGMLVLTSLYPFWQLEPRIRFWTGDVVQVGPRCAATDTHGVRFKGRFEHCVYDDLDQEFKLFSTEVAEVLDEFPDVSRKNHLHYDMGSQSEETGFLRFSIIRQSDSAPSIRLEVELRYDPDGYRSKVAALEQEILRKLQQANSASKQTADGSGNGISIKFVRPGELQGDWLIC